VASSRDKQQQHGVTAILAAESRSQKEIIIFGISFATVLTRVLIPIADRRQSFVQLKNNKKHGRSYLASNLICSCIRNFV
jgi:hypothetical protein